MRFLKESRWTGIQTESWLGWAEGLARLEEYSVRANDQPATVQHVVEAGEGRPAQRGLDIQSAWMLDLAFANCGVFH